MEKTKMSPCPDNKSSQDILRPMENVTLSITTETVRKHDKRDRNGA